MRRLEYIRNKMKKGWLLNVVSKDTPEYQLIPRGDMGMVPLSQQEGAFILKNFKLKRTHAPTKKDYLETVYEAL